MSLAPITIDLNLDTSAFSVALRGAIEQVNRMAELLRRSAERLGGWDALEAALRPERPVDRARRLRIDRVMRDRARRAARHGRVLR